MALIYTLSVVHEYWHSVITTSKIIASMKLYPIPPTAVCFLSPGGLWDICTASYLSQGPWPHCHCLLSSCCPSGLCYFKAILTSFAWCEITRESLFCRGLERFWMGKWLLSKNICSPYFKFLPSLAIGGYVDMMVLSFQPCPPFLTPPHTHTF